MIPTMAIFKSILIFCKLSSPNCQNAAEAVGENDEDDDEDNDDDDDDADDDDDDDEAMDENVDREAASNGTMNQNNQYLHILIATNICLKLFVRQICK